MEFEEVESEFEEVESEFEEVEQRCTNQYWIFDFYLLQKFQLHFYLKI
ncbi:hypothetical protein OROGR_015661 [Orobanche gracilis]